MCRDGQLLLRQWKRFVQHNGVLYQEVIDNDDGVLRQVVVPSCFCNQILQAAHDLMGHQSTDRVQQLCKLLAYWPGTSNDIDYYINIKGERLAKFLRCQQSNQGQGWRVYRLPDLWR